MLYCYQGYISQPFWNLRDFGMEGNMEDKTIGLSNSEWRIMENFPVYEIILP